MEEERSRGGAGELPAAVARLGFSLLSGKAKLIALGIIAVALVAVLIMGVSLVVMASFAKNDKGAAANVNSGVCAAPAPAAAAGTTPVQGSPTTSPLPEYPDSVMPTVQQIIATARADGFPDEAALIAITAAMGESSLGTNTEAMQDPNGDGDQGYYQQRVKYRDGAWYGTPEQVTDIVWATRTFLNGTDNQYGHMPGLKDIEGWQGLAPAEAIHRVQRNDPDTNFVYAKNYEKARTLFAAVEGSAPASLVGAAPSANCAGTPVVATGATGDAAAVVAAAQTQVGLPYVFGGGDGTGPGASNMRSQDAGEIGFDCSGITSYGYQQAAGITLPRVASDQWAKYQSNIVPDDALQPGDLLFYAYGRKGSRVDHVAMYVGDGKMVEASVSANAVRVTTARTSANDSGYVGAARVLGSSTPAAGGDTK